MPGPMWPWQHSSQSVEGLTEAESGLQGVGLSHQGVWFHKQEVEWTECC